MEHRSPIKARAPFDIGSADDIGGAASTAIGQGEPWCGILANASPRDHIVQLYQDQQFLNRAVCRFAASALANGEGVILVPTVAHWDAFRPRIESEGVDVDASIRRGQLSIVDANDLLPTFMRDAMPDSPVFLGLAADVITRARGEDGTRRFDGGERW